MSVQAHEDLVSEVTRLRKSFDHMQTSLDQSVTKGKQLRDILDQVQHAREQSSTEIAQLRKQMNRLGSIDSVDKRLRKVEYNLSRIDGQVELLTKMQLAGRRLTIRSKRLPVTREGSWYGLTKPT